MENSEFTHLHVHSEYSMLDGLGSPDDYAKRAAEMGFKALALTDHGGINGCVNFQLACDKYGISPILGCEAYIVPNAKEAKEKQNKTNGHIILLVKNQEGFGNLCRLLTYANIEGFYYKPRIDYQTLLDHCKGLVISTACSASFLMKFDNGISFFHELKSKIGEDLYLEIMPHKIREQREMNKLALLLSRQTKTKIIATNDCHYIDRLHWKAQEVLLAIQTKARWDDPKRWKFSVKDLYLCHARELLRTLKKVSLGKRKYLTNTIEVAEKCSNFRIQKQKIFLPRVKNLPLKTEEKKFLWSLCVRGFRRKFKTNIRSNPIYYSRLKEEYSLINEKDFGRYFLVVWELVNWCKKNNIIVGCGRGSAAGSLMSLLLNITTVDPIKHNLLFSRFINKDRLDYPDIDIDFEDSKRHVVKQHLEQIYGEDHVAHVSSFNRMKAKSVVRDVGRVFDIPLSEVDSFAKAIEDNDEHTGIQEAIDTTEEGDTFYRKYPEIVKIAQTLEGAVRNYGVHAAALIVSRDSLIDSDRCNLIKRKVKGEETILINWEKNNAEYVGLMKLDALGLKLLSIFSETKRLILENHDENINIDQIDIEDKKTLKEISKGNTIGAFQLNTYAMTTLIKEMGINCFRDVSDALALVRPGPSSSGMTAEYVRRKNGARWEKQHHIYEKITRDTYGIIVYQEQIMEVIHKIAGLPYSTADKIRKIIGKKRDRKEFEPYKKKFVSGCLENKTFTRTEANEFWTMLQEHARYSFGKAHSVAYSILGVQSAWLKKYYPTEFICASLTYGSQTKKKLLIEEAYRLGLCLVLPKVGISEAIKWAVRGNKLYIPFIEVKSIGEAKAYQAATIAEPNKQNLFFARKNTSAAQHKGALRKLLESIESYNTDDSPIQITDTIQNHFDFRILTNPFDNYKNLYKFFDNKIRLDRVDSILSGNLKEIKNLNSKKQIITKAKFTGHAKLLSCASCERAGGRTAPVSPSPGRYTVAIVGECPGRDEDAQGIGFVGASGKALWKIINKHNYHREDFHITNVVKCFQPSGGPPTTKQIKTCGRFLKYELHEIKPKIILSCGNTALNFFTGQASGIMNTNGKTIWNEEYSSWICFCLHPAAVLHNPENKAAFNSGMANFLSLLNNLNFKK